MKRQLRDDPKLHSYVKKDIYELACSLKEPNELAYIYRIIYNIFCKKIKLSRSIDEKDLLIHASKRYFSSKNDPSDKTYGNGGSSRSTLYDIISKSGISFTVYFSESKQFRIQKRETDIQHIRQFPLTTKFMPFYTEITNKNDDDNDLIIYINETYSYQSITDTLLFNNINFELECCTISFMMEPEDPTVPNTVKGHAVVGYKCDGYNKIYDSSANKIANIDWQQLDTPSIIKQFQSILEKWWSGEKVFNIHIATAIYVNKYKSDFYAYTGTC
jgi:hypothetical protein